MASLGYSQPILSVVQCQDSGLQSLSGSAEPGITCCTHQCPGITKYAPGDT